MKRMIGWTVLATMWACVAARVLLWPSDLVHAGYSATATRVMFWVDALLVMPPWLILQLFLAPAQAPWVYHASSAAYVLVLSTLIYEFLIR